jgi:hypothetical protein
MRGNIRDQEPLAHRSRLIHTKSPTFEERWAEYADRLPDEQENMLSGNHPEVNNLLSQIPS